MSNVDTTTIEEKAALMNLSQNNKKKDEQEEKQQHDDSKLTAATALAGLVDSPSPKLEEAEQNEEEDEEEFHIPQRYTRSGRKRAVSFPLKLMKVLSKKEFHDIITWMPSGKSFNILNSKRFTAEILPEYFKNAKYSSFTRKLHRWGFIRHYRGEEAGAFFHKNFQKARFDLVEKMTCYKQEPPKSASAPAVAAAARKPTIPAVPLVRPIPSVLAPPAPAAAGDVGLNAAIELEVARRVQERIDVAALRRLVMMRQEQAMMQEQNYLQQQEQQLLQQERQMLQHQEQQRRQQQQLFAVGAAQQQQQWSQTGLELLKRSLPQQQQQQQFAFHAKPAPLPARNFGTNHSDLPKTNIFGAKTA